MCGETVSNLIRKVLIAEATMLNFGWKNDEHPEYDCQVQIPNNSDGEDDDDLMQEKINRIRRMLGWREIELR